MSSGWLRTNYSWYRFLLKKELVIVLAIMLLCFGLRIFNFSSASLWVDEAYTLMLSHQKTHDIVKISINDINPPLYGITVRKWAKTFGYSHESIRFFSVLCSLLTGIVLYRIGRKFFNYFTAIAAVLFFSFSNLQIYYAEEARGYAMACALCAFSIYYFLSFLTHKKYSALIGLFVANTFVLYTHYVAGFLFVAEGLIAIALLFKQRKKLFWFIISQILALGSFLPWFLLSWFSLDGFQIGWLPELSFEGFKFFFMQVLNSEVTLILLLVWIAVSIVLFFVAKNRRKLKLYFALLILSSLPMILICLSTEYYVRLFLDRYILFTTVLMFLFFAYMFAAVRMHLMFKIILLGTYLYFAGSNVQISAFRNEEWDRACLTGAALTNENTSVLLNPPYLKYVFDYYNLRWSYDHEYRSLDAVRDKYDIFPIGDTNDIKKITYRLKNRIIFYSSHYWGETNDKKTIESYLSKGYNQTYFHQFWNVRLYVYEKRW